MGAVKRGERGVRVGGLLRDFDNWAHLNLAGIGDATGVGVRSLTTPEIVSCMNTPPDAKQ